MEHIAIDVGARESQVCIRSPDGSIRVERRVATSSLPLLLSKQREKSRVIVETSAEAFAIADKAIAAGHEVRVVPATLVGALGVGSRRTKNDRRDAQVLSEVSCRIDLPSVHVPSEQSRTVKSLCASRESLIRSRTLLINAVRGWLRTQLRPVEVRTGTTRTFPERARKAISDLPDWIGRQLTVIESLNAQIGEADKQLVELAKDDSTCRRLMTVPGVGPLTSILFVAVLDRAERFDSAHKVQAYLGLTPGENSSGDRQRRTSITKAGNSAMRRALVQAAWAARNTKSVHPMLDWVAEVEKRRGKRVAIVALARKIAGILFALWRDGTDYEPRLGASNR